MRKLIILAIPILFMACSDSHHHSAVAPYHETECLCDINDLDTIAIAVCNDYECPYHHGEGCECCKGHDFEHEHEVGDGEGQCHE